MLLFSSDFRSYCLIMSRLGREFVARKVAPTVREPAFTGIDTSGTPSPASPAIPCVRPTPLDLKRCAPPPSVSGCGGTAGEKLARQKFCLADDESSSSR